MYSHPSLITHRRCHQTLSHRLLDWVVCAGFRVARCALPCAGATGTAVVLRHVLAGCAEHILLVAEALPGVPIAPLEVALRVILADGVCVAVLACCGAASNAPCVRPHHCRQQQQQVRHLCASAYLVQWKCMLCQIVPPCPWFRHDHLE